MRKKGLWSDFKGLVIAAAIILISVFLLYKYSGAFNKGASSVDREKDWMACKVYPDRAKAGGFPCTLCGSSCIECNPPCLGAPDMTDDGDKMPDACELDKTKNNAKEMQCKYYNTNNKDQCCFTDNPCPNARNPPIQCKST